MDNWQTLCAETTEAMREHVTAYSIPIHRRRVEDLGDYGEHEGSGALLATSPLLALSNHHVLERANREPLAYVANDSEHIWRLQGPYRGWRWPRDVAVGIADRPEPSSTRAIPLQWLDTHHAPHPDELLFVLGFSAERSQFRFETIFNAATPYLTQQHQGDISDERFDPNYHFALPYPTEKAQPSRPGVARRGLPIPRGMSGTLVWNTKRIEAEEKGIPWAPDQARVTGIVWGWPSNSALLYCTKVETVHALLEEISRDTHARSPELW